MAIEIKNNPKLDLNSKRGLIFKQQGKFVRQRMVLPITFKLAT